MPATTKRPPRSARPSAHGNGSNGNGHPPPDKIVRGKTGVGGFPKSGNGKYNPDRYLAEQRRAAKPATSSSPKPARAAAAPELEVHPYCFLLPRMSDGEYAATREAIRAEGRVLVPLMLLDGKILDGRHRYEIARELGVPFDVEHFDPAKHGDPVRYVYNMAVGRHMDPSQKACAAVKFMEQAGFADAAKARQSAAGGAKNGEFSNNPSACGKFATSAFLEARRLVRGRTRDQMRRVLEGYNQGKLNRRYQAHVGPIPLILPAREDMVARILEGLYAPAATSSGTGKSRDQAAELFGVAPRLIQDAKSLKEQAPDLFDQAFDGRIAVSRAMSEYKRREKQKSLAAAAAEARKHFHAIGADHPCEIVHGDAVEELEGLDPRPSLIFTDPPYNLGLDYGGGAKADSLPESKYLEWCRRWLALCADVLAGDGSLFVMIDVPHLAEFMTTLTAAGLYLRDVIVWREEFGNYAPSRFTCCWRPIIYCTKHKSRYVWNGDDVTIPSARQLVYQDKRAVESGKVIGNVWSDIPRLVGNAEERMPGFPTQLSVAIAERIIRVASDPGDLVVDPFSGTGSTGHAALLHGRRYLGIDIVEKNVTWSRRRLDVVFRNLSKGAKP